ncbi:MAG: ParB/RepB/Spo0J family partition protein [Candidatus Eremiobacteraeota bacterium]|nr:ParB/RepB/Spo0J family partition protein [Candidatus Eremiobacteraeota bacterium]
MSGPQKRGLGRGLGALLGEGPLPTAPSGEHLREIPVAQITPNPFQPRKSFDAQALEDLRSSIAEFGVLIPVIVREREGGYELVAGERRWRACAALQRDTIPAIVRRSDDRDSLEVAIIENLQRENLNALEEAAGFGALIDEYSFTQDQLAQRVGKSRPAVTNALRLLALPDAVKAMIAAGRLSAGHARAILSAPEDRRVALAQRVVSQDLSVREVERLAGGEGKPRERTAASSRLAPEHADFEARLRQKTGAHVALKAAGNGGKIEIRYTDQRDLIRIADALLGPID